MKKQFTFITLLTLLLGMMGHLPANATDYGIYVGETMVTDKNAKDILGNGYFRYDNSKKYLYVKAGITYSNSGTLGNIISNRSVSGLVVYFEGAATLTARNSVIHSQNNDMKVIFTGGKTVKMTSTGGYPVSASDCKLELTTMGGRAYMTAEGKEGWAPVLGMSGATLSLNGYIDLTVNANSTGAIAGFDNVTCGSNVSIALPSGATYDTSRKKLVDAFGDNVTNQTVRVVPTDKLTNYSVYVGGVQVNNYNAINITAKTISGGVSYSSSSKTLTLSAGTTIDMRNVSKATSQNCISGSIDGLTVKSGSNVTLYGHSSNSAIYFTDNATVTTTTASTSDVTDLTLVNSSSKAGIMMRYNSKLTLKNAKIKTGRIAGYNGETGNSLSFEGAYTLVRTDRIDNFKSVSYDTDNNLTMALPLGGAYILPERKVVDINGNEVSSGILVAKTTNYPVYWGDMIINNWAAGDVLGDGSKAVRYVRSSDTKGTLYLKNVNYENYGSLGSCVSNRGIKDFTIVVEGTNNFTARNAPFNTYFEGGDSHTVTFKGGGTLNLKSTESYTLHFGKNSSIVFDNITLNSDAYTDGINGSKTTKLTFKNVVADIRCKRYPIKDIASMTFEGCDIYDPAGVSLKDGILYYANGNQVPEGTRVKIGPVTNYYITVGGVPVNSANCNDVLGDGGSVKYDEAYHRLDLTNANISSKGIVIGKNAPTNQRINVKGYCKVSGSGADAALTTEDHYVELNGDGELRLEGGAKYAVYVNKGTVDVRGYSVVDKGPSLDLLQTGNNSCVFYGATGEENLTFNQSAITAQGHDKIISNFKKVSIIGYPIIYPSGGYYDETKKMLCSADGTEVVYDRFEVGPVVDYPIEVAGVRVNDKNCDSFTAPGVSGSVTYEASTHTLKLNNATIDCENWCVMAWDSEDTQLTIEVTGNCVLKNKKYPAISVSNTWPNKTTTIKGTGTLTIEAGEGKAFYGNGTLKFAGSVKVKATGIITEFSDVNFADGEGVIVPNSAVYDTSNKVMPMRDGSPATTIEIGPVEYYGLWIGYVQVNSANKDGVTDKDISGKVTYAPSTHTLTLNGATIKSAVAPISIEYQDWAHMQTAAFGSDRLTVRLVGENKYTQGDLVNLNRDFVFKGPGSFKMGSIEFDGGNQLTIDDEATLECGYIYGTGKEIVTVDFSTLKTTGAIENIGELKLFDAGFFSPDPGCFDSAKKMVVDASGNKATNIHIGKGGAPAMKNYDVWVAGTRITSVNCDGVTGTGISGSVTYDYETHTLTLNDATIDGKIEHLDDRGLPFNIVVNGKNTAKYIAFDTAVQRDITISGSGELNMTGDIPNGAVINVNGNALIKDVTLQLATSIWGNNCGTITIDGATITAKGDVIGIGGFDKMELLGGVGILLPVNGKFDETEKCIVNQNGSRYYDELLVRPLTPEEAGIEGIGADAAGVRSIYNTQGVRTDKMQKGVNIIRLENGKTVKVRR